MRTILSATVLCSFFIMLTAADYMPAPESTDEIVISGQRIPPPPVVSGFVQNVVSPVRGQLAAFRQPICPKVLGLDSNDAAKVVARMQLVAQAASIRMTNQPCSTNFTVIVAADGRSFMQDVWRKRFQSLESLTNGQRDQLLRSPGPAWAWRGVAQHSVDGMGNMPPDPALGGGAGAEASGGSGTTALPVSSSSLFKLQVRQDVGDAYVVIDEKALDDKSAVQIADYAMMRGIAGAQPPTQSMEGRSILSLFDAGVQPPKSLTYLDLALLTTVYELPMNLPFVQQIDAITSRINRYDTARRAEQSLKEDEREN